MRSVISCFFHRHFPPMSSPRAPTSARSVIQGCQAAKNALSGGKLACKTPFHHITAWQLSVKGQCTRGVHMMPCFTHLAHPPVSSPRAHILARNVTQDVRLRRCRNLSGKHPARRALEHQITASCSVTRFLLLIACMTLASFLQAHFRNSCACRKSLWVTSWQVLSIVA